MKLEIYQMHMLGVGVKKLGEITKPNVKTNSPKLHLLNMKTCI